MKTIIFTLLFFTMVYTTQNYSLTDPIKDCSAITGQWEGIWTHFVPKQGQYCVYTTQIDSAITADTQWNTLYTSKNILSLGNCPSLEDIFEAICLYNNGYIKQVNTDFLLLSGQGQSNSLMFNGFSDDFSEYQAYQTWQMVPSINGSQTSQFQQQMLNTIYEYNTLGFQSQQCQNLEGQWSGQGIYQSIDFYSNAVYEVIVFIQSTSKSLNLAVYSNSINISGEEGDSFDEYITESITLDCNSDQSTFSNQENTISGIFSQDSIFVDVKYQERNQNVSFVLFREDIQIIE